MVRREERLPVRHRRVREEPREEEWVDEARRSSLSTVHVRADRLQVADVGQAEALVLLEVREGHFELVLQPHRQQFTP